MTKVIMVQGTMSNAGKSAVAAGLCRIFKQDGYRVAPFKSQNMALNSFVTAEGLEMGRAQVMQAEAAGIRPMVEMNPILLKPTDNEGSQVIVNGKVFRNMRAWDYYAYKQAFIPEIKKAFRFLSEQADIIVIEGAGSPAEINLRENDLVNMGLAEMVDAPVLLIGDIDRGGVFAQLLGTIMLFTPEERARVTGMIINKFRGDKALLDPGIAMLEERAGIPVTGVIPMLDVKLDDEDSLSTRLTDHGGRGEIDIAVIRLPKLSNFTDFDVFEQFPEISVRYVDRVGALGVPDLLVIPGSKSTIADLNWMRERGLDEAVLRYAKNGGPVVGVCGGYLMLGERVDDPVGAEGGGSAKGLGLLPVVTVLKDEKTTRQFTGSFGKVPGLFAGLSGEDLEGYEIHMGETLPVVGAEGVAAFTPEGTGLCKDNVYGSYVHGIFDKAGVAKAVAKALADRKGVTLTGNELLDQREFTDREYDRLADGIRKSLDIPAVYAMMREARIS